MKKLWLVLALLGIWLLSVAASGVLPDQRNIAIDSSTWTAYIATRSAVGFKMKSRSRHPWKLSSSSTGAAYYSVATDVVVEFDLNVQRGSTVLYIQVETAYPSDTIEIFVLR